MLNKIQEYKNNPHLKQFQDVRVAGLLVFGIIILLVTWSGVGAIEQNYNLEQEISSLQHQDSLQQLQNNNLSLENQYYNTNEYLELEARQLFGKASPGEKLILVPQSVALQDTVNLSNQSNLASTKNLPKPTYQQNFESWVNFFFHRSS
jgi:cell division protein FtsB